MALCFYIEVTRLKRIVHQFGCILLSVFVAFQPLAWAADLPEGMQAQGVTNVDTTNPNGIIITANDQAIIDWNSFSIGENQFVQFILPSETSSILNRVTGSSASDIWGGLLSNGRVFLVNTNGINFHAGANVNVASLIASTLNISDANFIAKEFIFEKTLGSEIGKIINEANISAKGIALIAEQIQNKGLLEANLGTVVLGAGTKQVLSLDSAGAINLVVEKGSANAMITNEQNGTIRANGGKVLLTAKDLNNTLDNLVNNTGVIEATRMVETDGVVIMVPQNETTK